VAKSRLHQEAEQTLSPELRELFNTLVDDYEESFVRHTRGHKKLVNYRILADLIMSGWRKGESVPASSR
jgi:hypothetical protein